MNNRKGFIGFAVLVALFVGISCKTKKAAVAKEQPKKTELPSANLSLAKSIALNENNFDYYYARGSADYKDQQQDFNLNVEIIMEKDQYVYMNITAILGVSVARVWITKDSISILDILHKKHLITSYEYIRKMTNVLLTLKQVQHIFAGNTIYEPDPEKMTADTILNYILINTPVSPQQLQTTYYQNQKYKVTRSIISDKVSQRELRVEYKKTFEHGENSYPKEFDINIRAEKNVECRFALDYFAFEKKKETRFVVPKSFETIRM